MGSQNARIVPTELHLFDTIILGAGSMGLAAGYELARRGQRVLLLDEYESPHTFGSHHGDTRLLRLAYGEGADYVPLGKQALKRWYELEQERQAWTNETLPLFSPVGIVGVLHPTSPMIAEIDKSSAEFNLQSASLSPKEAMQRWPGLVVPEWGVVRFDPDAGVLHSEDCVRTLKEGCLFHGAVHRIGGTVEHMMIRADSVEVKFGGETYYGSNLVLALGAGAPDILHRWFPDWQIPLQPIRKTLAWFQPERGCYHAPEFPAYYVDTGTSGWYYGFPDFGDGVKLGRHDGGEPCDRLTVNRTFMLGSDDEHDLRNFIRNYLPQADGELNRGAVCIYTMTPDEHFVIDSHPVYKNVVIAAGFSGHGFKFASAIGSVLADLTTKGHTTLDISLFQSRRFQGASRTEDC